jgi:hypothetical protein
MDELTLAKDFDELLETLYAMRLVAWNAGEKTSVKLLLKHISFIKGLQSSLVGAS